MTTLPLYTRRRTMNTTSVFVVEVESLDSRTTGELNCLCTNGFDASRIGVPRGHVDT